MFDSDFKAGTLKAFLILWIFFNLYFFILFYYFFQYCDLPVLHYYYTHLTSSFPGQPG